MNNLTFLRGRVAITLEYSKMACPMLESELEDSWPSDFLLEAMMSAGKYGIRREINIRKRTASGYELRTVRVLSGHNLFYELRTVKILNGYILFYEYCRDLKPK